MIALQTENLKVGYGKKVVVDSIDISGIKGQVLCLLGPNGAGKSTILRTLSGLLEPLGGVVYVNDQELSSKKKKELAKELAIVLTKKFTGGLMKAYDVTAMGRYPHTNHFGTLEEHDHQLIRDALKAVNAEELSDRYYEELSDGEKQKIMVARALVQEPEVMILDEPTTHLDIRHRLELIGLLKNLSRQKNMTIILALHEIDLALKSCDKVLLIKDNQIMGYGPPEDVVDEAIICDLYDIKNANFNNLLGSIELQNRGLPEVFVIPGNGSGIPIYRLLTKHDIGISTGIVHENDIDYEIARTMGLTIKSERAFEEINDVNYLSAKKMIDKVDVMVDSGFPIRKTNQKNLDLIHYAISKGKKVISYRKEDELDKLFKEKSALILTCCNASNLIDYIQSDYLKMDRIKEVKLKAVL